MHMRNDRGISLAAIVVMLCCMGSVVNACPIANSNAHIASVIVHAHPCEFDGQVSKKLDFKTEFQTTGLVFSKLSETGRANFRRKLEIINFKKTLFCCSLGKNF